MTRSRQKKTRTAVRRHQRKSMRRSAKKSALSHLHKRDRCKRQGSTYTRKTSIRKKQSRIQKRTQQQRKRKSRFPRRGGGDDADSLWIYLEKEGTVSYYNFKTKIQQDTVPSYKNQWTNLYIFTSSGLFSLFCHVDYTGDVCDLYKVCEIDDDLMSKIQKYRGMSSISQQSPSVRGESWIKIMDPNLSAQDRYRYLNPQTKESKINTPIVNPECLLVDGWRRQFTLRPEVIDDTASGSSSGDGAPKDKLYSRFVHTTHKNEDGTVCQTPEFKICSKEDKKNWKEYGDDIYTSSGELLKIGSDIAETDYCEWEEAFDEYYKRKYWCNKKTRETTYDSMPKVYTHLLKKAQEQEQQQQEQQEQQGQQESQQQQQLPGETSQQPVHPPSQQEQPPPGQQQQQQGAEDAANSGFSGFSEESPAYRSQGEEAEKREMTHPVMSRPILGKGMRKMRGLPRNFQGKVPTPAAEQAKWEAEEQARKEAEEQAQEQAPAPAPPAPAAPAPAPAPPAPAAPAPAPAPAPGAGAQFSLPPSEAKKESHQTLMFDIAKQVQQVRQEQQAKQAQQARRAQQASQSDQPSTLPLQSDLQVTHGLDDSNNPKTASSSPPPSPPPLPPQNASDRLPLQKSVSAPQLRRKSSFHTRRKMRTHLSASGYKKWG